MQRLIFSIFLGLVLCIAPSVYAQVTIGLGTAPVAGALLDLKEQDVVNGIANSNKGLGMPRVSINTTSPAVGALAASIGGQGVWDEAAHVGLMVYNIKEDFCATQPIAKGIYVWDGTQWQGLGVGVGTVGVGVIEHPAKAGVYEAFTSALFGTAGRWMTTNLAATAYDGNKHSQDPARTITFMPNGSSTDNNQAYWCYPNQTELGSLLSTEYEKNKALGYLYTWDAATAGKGGVNGMGDIYNTSGSFAAKNESDYPENTTGNQVANQQQRRQGICPAGWHLPSDWEWTQLEQEIIKNTTAYANVTSIIDAGGTDATVATPVIYFAPGSSVSSSSRGSTHGAAMKAVCPVSSSIAILPNGTSKGARDGGFAGVLAGSTIRGNTPTANGLGSFTAFWTSSSMDEEVAWVRKLQESGGKVNRGLTSRYQMWSVRCKQDTP